ncbi:Galactosyl transferase GMA12/MNN10 family protein [Rhynchospora pubera]|uniref:Galactosyl transferase GMA12/MNN10 family protein n=1 Tax=Rhynchospora pubera TaxID=906938 RepID=A0AAV8FE81_9POAL|nr:Galactosyl transferase GMA12/MNN10 family protein [Rhynchospora pubera]
MARSSTTKPSALVDGLVFTAGAFMALLIFFGLYSFLSPDPVPNRLSSISLPLSSPRTNRSTHDPSDQTFYDDPSLTYTIEKPISNWDEKRSAWLKLHPSFSAKTERVLMVSGSQPKPCPSYDGDHLLLRSLKNKVDYCRIHDIELFYNTALFHPSMPTFWAKIPVIRAAMLAHPESDWVWWVDSDAIFTDMDFFLPLDRYRDHNMVVHGWPKLVYEEKSWVALNAGVFLIRNCQWSLDFMDEWASMGPPSPDYEKWGKILTSTFKNKVFTDSDDQSALVYLILTGKGGWRDKIYLENEYYFEGYWVEIVGRLENIAARYNEMEKRGPAVLRRRHAEGVFVSYAKQRDAQLGRENGAVSGPKGWKRPFLTHFTGCQPCNGKRNEQYSGDNCTEGMYKALNFADDQVLRAYGFRHANMLSGDVQPLPFDYPRARI